MKAMAKTNTQKKNKGKDKEEDSEALKTKSVGEQLQIIIPQYIVKIVFQFLLNLSLNHGLASDR